MQAVSVLLRGRPRRRRPHHRPARRDYDFWRDVPARRSGATGCSSFAVAEPAHAGDRRAHASPRTRTTTRCRSTPTSGVNPGDAQPVDLPADRRAAQLRARAPTPATSCLVNWPMIDYFERPGHRRARRRPTHLAARPASCRCRCSTGCRPRRRAPTAAPGFPGLRLRGDVTGTPTAWRRRPTSASPGASGPSTRSSSRTCRSRCAATRAPVALPRLGRRRHVPHRPAPVDRRRQLHRRRLAARSRSRSAR